MTTIGLVHAVHPAVPAGTLVADSGRNLWSQTPGFFYRFVDL
jgi:hypothetical protein